jgi:hypothetical protein
MRERYGDLPPRPRPGTLPPPTYGGGASITASGIRPLKSGEIAYARRVFRETVPYGEVFVTPLMGAGGAAFTLPGPTGYMLNVGPTAFSQDMSGPPDLKQLLIHELTHVWQGEHGSWPGSYVFDSVWHQGKSIAQTGDRNNAYTYTAGRPWSWYNVEQQANIVQDWSVNQSLFSLLYPYIQFHIRAGRP